MSQNTFLSDLSSEVPDQRSVSDLTPLTEELPMMETPLSHQAPDDGAANFWETARRQTFCPLPHQASVEMSSEPSAEMSRRSMRSSRQVSVEMSTDNLTEPSVELSQSRHFLIERPSDTNIPSAEAIEMSSYRRFRQISSTDAINMASAQSSSSTEEGTAASEPGVAAKTEPKVRHFIF